MRPHLQLIALGWLAACRPAPPAVPAEPPKDWSACLNAPPQESQVFDDAELAIERGASEVRMDARGCRVLRRLPSPSDVRRTGLEAVVARDGGALPALVYVRDVGVDFTRDRIDAQGDGVFEVELYERNTDAGWQESEQVKTGPEGRRRIHESRLSDYLKRTVRDRWVDGGWVIESDVTEPIKPQVVPIRR